METVIVAFESTKNCWYVKDILESAGVASCVVCRSAAEVKRAVNKQAITTVVSGYKFQDESAEGLFDDLPPACSMLVLARQSLLDMIGNDDIFKLAAPVPRGDLLSSVRMLLQMGRRLERFVRPRRSAGDQAIISEAKSILMARNGMTEEQAHRFLQKQSMDSGARLVQTARLVVDGIWNT